MCANPEEKRRAYIVSLKYAPGLAKEFCLLGDNLERHGWCVVYLLSQEYAWLTKPVSEVHYLTSSANSKQMVLDTIAYLTQYHKRFSQIFTAFPPEFLCLYNPHPLNFVVALLAQRACPDGIRVVYLHEPYKPDKSSFGTLGVLYFSLAEFFQTLSLKYMTSVIVPSSNAQSLFLKRYPTYSGTVYMAPILLPNSQETIAQPRKYVSLVGTINRSRGLDSFVSMINCVAAQGENVQFKIVTRGDIAEALQDVSAAGRHLLHIVNKPKVSDEEIADTVAQSMALFLPHKQVTQSGNVPIAFRCGTPIIARNLPGFTQHIRHKENGCLVPYDATPEQLLEAIRYVRDNFTRLSRNARASFEETFSEQNWDRYYEWLIRDTIGNGGVHRQ